jgi:NAD(P)-dependent dehydrogenase (short-subunit alcohol dehydrogenase family)
MTGTVIVTGANGGIGVHLVSRLLSDGWNVAALDIAVDNLDDLCSTHSERLLTQTADMRESGQLADAVTQTVNRFGGIDALVNNAGVWTIGPFESSAPEGWRRDIEVNLVGPMHLTHLVLPHFFASGAGRIVNVVSDSGRVGEPLVAVYSGAKAGLAGFSRSLAKEVGKRGVNVNCVSLSTTVTEAARETYTDDQLQKMVARYPMRRLGTPADAVGMIAFLLGDESTWITGQTISVNGGYAIL